MLTARMRMVAWSQSLRKVPCKIHAPERKITHQLQHAKLSNYYMSIKLSVLQYANIRKQVKKSLEYDMLAYAFYMDELTLNFRPTVYSTQ